MNTLGLSFLTRDSGGGLTLVSRHPPSSPTWYWSLSWQPYRADETRWWLRLHLSPGTGQRHHSLCLLGLGRLMLSTQDYHKQFRA